jgi:hypothetical protein
MAAVVMMTTIDARIDFPQTALGFGTLIGCFHRPRLRVAPTSTTLANREVNR